MNLWIIQDGFRSFIYVIKIRGPSHEPWGMPPVMSAKSEWQLPNLTLCCLSLRNENNHLTTGLGTSIAIILFNRGVVVNSVKCLTVVYE